ncbi:MAG: CocE/NonD family hydrolase [Solirubrobacteraceae bacterium]
MTLLSKALARRMRLIEPRTLDVICERDLRATMDDGVVLLADRWVASDTAATEQPSVLVRSPYGRRQFVGLLMGRLLAERGFQVVVQSVRGTFGSGGEFDPFDERADGLATLKWLRGQPWHTGRVATIGPSYLGLVQWAIAQPAGDELAAMAIQVSASQFYDETYAGGSVSLETVASWLVLVAFQEHRLAPVAINRGLRALRGALSDARLDEIDVRVTGGEVVWLRDALKHPGRDSEHWLRRDYSRTVADVRAPVSFVGGWHDILLPWMLEDFKVLQEAERSPQLLIGPWTHTSSALMGAGQREGIAWMRAHLLGDDRLVRDSKVRVMVTGEGGGWRELERWPPENTEPRTLYLGAERTLTGEPPAHERPQPPAFDYRYDPADPTPSLGGAVLLSREPVVDNAALEQRDDVLTFTTEPLAETVEAIGEVSAELWARAQPPHFDLFVRVCEVGADGVSRNVCDGLRSVEPDDAAISEEGVAHVVVQLWPTAHRFAAGSRIRVQVSSGAHPRFARNPGTGEDRATVGPDRMRPVDVELLRDRAHPSRVILPVTL